MICKKCGKEVADNEELCPYCGADLKDDSLSNEDVNSSEKTAKELTNKNKFILFMIPVLAVIIAVAVFVLPGLLSATPLLDDDSIVIYGYNGTAYVDTNYTGYTYDIVKKETEILNKLNNTADSSNYYKLYSQYNGLENLASSVSCEFEGETTGLSNGDKVTLACSYDKDAAKQAGIRYRNTKKTVTIKDLEDAEEIVIFDNLAYEWEYDGYNIEGTATSTSDNIYASTLTFAVEAENDELIVRCTKYAEEIIENGYSVVDEDCEIIDGYYQKVFAINNQYGYITNFTGDESIDANIRTILDAEVYRFVDDKAYTIENLKTKTNYSITDYAFESFEDGKATYTIKTNGGDFTLTFKTDLAVMPDGSVMDADRNYVANHFHGYDKYGDGTIQ